MPTMCAARSRLKALAAAAALALPAAHADAGTAESLAAAAWDGATVDAIAKAADTPQTVEALVLKLTPGADATTGVCSYAFADLGGRGAYRLVASVDRSGRDFCNLVVVIGRAGGRYQVQTIDAWRADEVADVIATLDGRPGHQLAVPAALSNYESGPDCVAAWPVVYALKAGTLVAAGRDYPAFYRRELAERTLALKDAGAAAPCRTMETDKLKRWLGIDRRAGLVTARGWAISPDAGLRAKAARIFADIGDTAALSALAADREPAVADTAKAALK